MFAITPHEIGKPVGMRRVKPEWELATAEFIVSNYTDGDILASDGVSLEPAANEIPLTPAERIAKITSGNDLQIVMFKMFFKLHNRTRVLEGKQPIDVDAFLTYIEGELPPTP